MNSKILCSCIKCKSVKSIKGIFTHYKIAHTEYKEQHTKISVNANKKATKKLSSKKEDRIECYNLSPSKCKFCETALNYGRRNSLFCDNSCAAKFNNSHQSALTKQKKIRTLISKYFGMDIVGEFCKISFTSCKWCNKMFTKRKRESYCSSNCKQLRKQQVVENLSQESKNKMRIGSKNAAAVRGVRSKDEISLFNLCEKQFVNVTHNTQIIDGWDADILLHDYKIAILWNGPWHYKQLSLPNHSLKQVQTRDKIKIRKFREIGWNVLIYEDRHYTPASAFEDIKMVVAAGFEPAPDRI